MLQVNSTIFCYQTKNKTAKTRKSLGWGKKKKLVRQWRTPTKQTELLNTLWHEDSQQTRNPYSQILPDVCEKNFFRFVHSSNQQKTTLLQSCALVAVTISVLHSLTKKELKATLQTWEEDQTTFHQFLLLLTQKTQQYPEQESVDQAFHSPHPGPGQDPQFLHNKKNEKKLITAMLNDATYRSFKSTDYSSSHYVTFFFFFNLCYGYLYSHQMEFFYSSDVSRIFG